VSFDPDQDGPFAARRVGPAEAPPQWTVLARIPAVGAHESALSATLPTYAALEPSGYGEDASLAAAPLRVVEPPLPTRELPGEASSVRFDPPQHRGQAPRAEASASPYRREHYRLDPAEDRVRGSHGARRQSDETVSARMARWHASASPYAGVAVTATLIVTASLLYWLTVGRQQTASAVDEVFETPNYWSSETPMGPPVGAVIQPMRSLTEELAAPRLADATATATASTAESVVVVAERPPTKREAPDAEPALGAASSGGSPAIEPPQPRSSTPITPKPITPTPHASPYPVTDFPWFEFDLPTVAAANSSTSEERAQ